MFFEENKELEHFLKNFKFFVQKEKFLIFKKQKKYGFKNFMLPKTTKKKEEILDEIVEVLNMNCFDNNTTVSLIESVFSKHHMLK